MASDAELVILWAKHRQELRALLSSWNEQQETLLRAMVPATAPRSEAKHEPRDGAASRPTSLDGGSEPCGNPFSKTEPLSSRSQAAADRFAAPCGGSTEPAPLEIRSVRIYPFSEELRASAHEGGGAAGSEAELLSTRGPEALYDRSSEAAADQSDAPCGGGSAEPAPLENKSGTIRPSSEELRAPVPEGGGAADREACHAAQGTEGEGRPADTYDASMPWHADKVVVHADEQDVTVELSPSSAIVNHKAFEAICSLVIFCNAVFIAVATDYDIQHPGDDRATTFTQCAFVLEKAFLAFYLLEILLRIYAFRWRFFRCKDARWNCFDLFLVAHAIFDQGLQLLSSSSGGVSNLSFLRFFKLIKMFKLMRVFRLLRSFKGLRLVLNGIMGSMHAMMYAMILIIATTFVFGTAIVQSCAIYLQNKEPDAQASELIYELWGSVPQSMLTLFMAGTSGDDWRNLASPLEKVGVIAYTIFVFYLVFFVFVITNTLTSLFVEHTIMFAATDEQLSIQQEMEKKGEYVEKVKRFFDLVDTDGSGEITYKEFVENMGSPILHAFASTLDMDITDAQDFFHVLSGGGIHAVDVETFVVGCIKLRGHAKSMDLMEFMHSYKRSSKEIVFQQQVLLQRVTSVDKAVYAISELIGRLDTHVAHAAVGA